MAGSFVSNRSKRGRPASQPAARDTGPQLGRQAQCQEIGNSARVAVTAVDRIQIDLDIGLDTASVVVRPCDRIFESSPHSVEYLSMAILCMLRRAYPDLDLREVAFRHVRVSWVEEASRAFGASVRFAAADTRLMFPVRELASPSRLGNRWSPIVDEAGDGACGRGHPVRIAPGAGGAGCPGAPGRGCAFRTCRRGATLGDQRAKHAAGAGSRTYDVPCGSGIGPQGTGRGAAVKSSTQAGCRRAQCRLWRPGGFLEGISSLDWLYTGAIPHTARRVGRPGASPPRTCELIAHRHGRAAGW